VSNKLKLLKEKATRPRRTVAVLLDGEVRGQIEAVEDELDRLDAQGDSNDKRLASKSNKAQRDALLADLDALRASAAEAIVYLVLEAMPRSPYLALIAKYPPRKDADGKVLPEDALGANTDEWWPALIRGCVIGERKGPNADDPIEPLEPGLLDWLLDEHATDRQVEVLARSAMALCRGDDAVPLPRRRSQTEASASA
jgi:hypothetical protein